jgi:carboxypeptidase T
VLGLGPTVATPITTVVALAGSSATITAVVSSDLLGDNPLSSGRPTPKPVSAAEYTIDTPPWVTGTMPVSMSASSGLFGSNSVTVSAPIDTSALSIGRHLVYIHGRSADGYWGPVTAIWLMPAHQYILPLIYR